MHFTLSLLTALATSALASPNPLITSRDVITTEQAEEAIKFAAQAAECDVFDCVAVVAAAACIAGGIAAGNPAVVIGCVGGGAPSVRSILSSRIAGNLI
jgi:hypothetical protein